MNVTIRETQNINTRAIDAGLEPPVCLTWHVHTDGGHDDVHRPAVLLPEPVQHIDHQRMRAFTHLMYEIGES